jgi:hypothetical protein
MVMPDHRHLDIDERMLRIQTQMDSFVPTRLAQETTHRIEDAIKRVAGDITDLKHDFEEAEVDRRANVRSLRNLVLAAVFSGVVSLIGAVVLTIASRHT